MQLCSCGDLIAKLIKLVIQKVTTTPVVSSLALVVLEQGGPLPDGERRRGGHHVEHPRQAGPVCRGVDDVAAVHPE